MLTADLVRARRSKGELKISSLKGKTSEVAYEFASRYLDVVSENIGIRREDLTAKLDDIPVPPRQQKLALGLRKMVLDDCEFEAEAGDPAAFRQTLFLEAAKRRAEAEFEEDFSRDALLAEIATEHKVEGDPEDFLFADLKSRHRLTKSAANKPDDLIARYGVAQVEALLLRAEKLSLQIQFSSVGSTRAFFRKMKFHRLMHDIKAIDADGKVGGYQIDIEGPTSLFVPSTKYGIRLGWLYRDIIQSSAWSLNATIRWGKERTRLTYSEKGKGTGEIADSLNEDAEKLLAKMKKRASAKWKLKINNKVFNTPGIGVFVPDFECTHEDGRKAYIEILGYWSRDAVWKRIEHAEKGLDSPVLFCAPGKLRVSEEILEEGGNAALYVYKSAIIPKNIEEKLDAISSR